MNKLIEFTKNWKHRNLLHVVGGLFVNSHSYLLWLLKNNKVGFLQLLSVYLLELLQNEEFKSKLDKLI